MARTQRPKRYSHELGIRICEVYASTHKSLRTIIDENHDFPTLNTLFDWLATHKAFDEQYGRAKRERADYLAEMMLEVAHERKRDDKQYTGMNHVHRDRLIIETHKFIAGKLSPKVWGDCKSDDDPNDGSKPSGVSNEQFAQLIAACLGNKSTE